jgi:hypothetical protein
MAPDAVLLGEHVARDLGRAHGLNRVINDISTSSGSRLDLDLTRSFCRRSRKFSSLAHQPYGARDIFFAAQPPSSGLVAMYQSSDVLKVT